MILRAGTSIHSPATPAVSFKPNMPPRLQVPADYTAATGGADSSDGHRFAQVSPGSEGYFVSEFGVIGMASFESLSPSFDSDHWGALPRDSLLHGRH